MSVESQQVANRWTWHVFYHVLIDGDRRYCSLQFYDAPVPMCDQELLVSNRFFCVLQSTEMVFAFVVEHCKPSLVYGAGAVLHESLLALEDRPASAPAPHSRSALIKLYTRWTIDVFAVVSYAWRVGVRC